MRFAKSVVAALVVSLATLVAVPALAETGAKRATPAAEDGGKHGKKFPMARGTTPCTAKSARKTVLQRSHTMFLM